MGTPEDFEAVYDLVASGRARPVVDAVFPLAEARAAHERLEAGEQLGKVLRESRSSRREDPPPHPRPEGVSNLREG